MWAERGRGSNQHRAKLRNVDKEFGFLGMLSDPAIGGINMNKVLGKKWTSFLP